jgi:hypothetical protein
MNATARTTRECSLDSLQPDLLAAIRKHAEQYKMGDMESSIRMCCETISTEKKRGLFSSGVETTITGTLLTPEWLIVAVKKGDEEPVVISGHLKNLQSHNFEDSAMFKINPDAGLNITGRYSDVTKQGMVFIGLGPEPAAQKFRQAVKEAIQGTSH